LIFDLGSRYPAAHWVGTMTRPLPGLHLPADADLFAVRFAPGGLFALLGAPLAALADTAIDTRDSDWALHDVAERLASLRCDHARARHLAAVLLRRAARRDADLSACVLLRRVETMRELPTVAALADALCVSTRSLERRFQQWVGVTPKQHLASLRFQRACARLPWAQGMAALSAELGYYDQAHFIGDFRRFSGTTPAAWRAMARASAHR
jgi:AraC-like DNA-binding protein